VALVGSAGRAAGGLTVRGARALGVAREPEQVGAHGEHAMVAGDAVVLVE
jgi:hypothetical protein